MRETAVGPPDLAPGGASADRSPWYSTRIRSSCTPPNTHTRAQSPKKSQPGSNQTAASPQTRNQVCPRPNLNQPAQQASALDPNHCHSAPHTWVRERSWGQGQLHSVQAATTVQAVLRTPPTARHKMWEASPRLTPHGYLTHPGCPTPQGARKRNGE